MTDLSPFLPTLLNAGVAGAVLLWFMLRLEGKLEALAHSVDLLARTVLVLAEKVDPSLERQVLNLSSEKGRRRITGGDHAQ